MATKRSNSINHQSFSLRRIILQRASRLGDNRNQRTIDLENGIVHSDTTENPNIEVRRSPEQSKCDSVNFYNLMETHDDDGQYCVICYLRESMVCPFYTLELCKHRFCMSCLVKYLKNEINESRTNIACPQCSASIHPNNIDFILKDYPGYKHKYEDFMIRRYLVADPDSRWCPAPDCSFAVIATGCASCPKIQCERPNCGVSFCYHCKAEWHPDQTCDAARLSRQNVLRTSSISQESSRRDEIKPCPRCQVLIVKMNDGSCNHMICSVCGAEFCWLCMKEVSDLHYLSPSGCTFWGKKPWSRKKKIVWQIGTLIGAPVGIALLAGIAIPSMVIGIPVWVGRKLFDRYKTKTKQKRNISVIVGVCASILISPILAGLAIAIGVPILLFYVYGIVPVSLCRAGCGNTTVSDEYKFEVNTDEENRQDAIDAIGETSIGEVSLSAASGSLIEGTNSTTSRPNPNINNTLRESTLALAGSMKNQKLDYTDDLSTESTSVITCNSAAASNMNDTNSAIALAGSITSSS